MITVWGIYLLTFFPGMMSPDSNDQWRQIVTGQFNDAHPVFHTLSMWLVTRIWLSPAAVVISQIIFLSLTVAWGIRLLEEHGLPSWAAWLLATIFTFAPLNANMVVVLWKDIPYSISLFLFSLMVLKIVLTRGEWLNKRFTWIWLGLISLCVASFRHNGLPIPIISIPTILIFYKNEWKPLLATMGFATSFFFIIHGPIYSLLGVDQAIGYKHHTLVHYIAAHIETGSPLTIEETHMAKYILPLSEWKYQCCNNSDIFHAKSYSADRFAKNVGIMQKLFVSLVIKEPLVDFRHFTCISSLVWEMPSRCGATTLLPYTASLWIDPGGSFFEENSLFPSLKKLLSGLLISIRTNPNLTIFIAPAVYLFLAICNTALLAYRRRSSRILLFIIPALIQSITLAVVNTSSDFRYQFGIYF